MVNGNFVYKFYVIFANGFTLLESSKIVLDKGKVDDVFNYGTKVNPCYIQSL
jgi:hypothetical protein